MDQDSAYMDVDTDLLKTFLENDCRLLHAGGYGPEQDANLASTGLVAIETAADPPVQHYVTHGRHRTDSTDSTNAAFIADIDSFLEFLHAPQIGSIAETHDEETELLGELMKPDSDGPPRPARLPAAGAVSPCRAAEIDKLAEYVKQVVEKSSSIKPEEMSAKLKVHEVILIVLLNDRYGDDSKDLRRILAFCNEKGCEVSTESRHFKTLDTETMALLWMKIKGNKGATYDTFARAMRARREKSTGYFEYLDTGKRSKKRVYRFGSKAMADMERMKQTLQRLQGARHF